MRFLGVRTADIAAGSSFGGKPFPQEAEAPRGNIVMIAFDSLADEMVCGAAVQFIDPGATEGGENATLRS
jgi:hypothetical protein